MNVHESERFARRAATNIADALSRAGLAEKYRESAALIEGTLAGLRNGCPDNYELAASVEAQLGSALFALRMVTDRLAAGAVYEPTPADVHHAGSDLVDETPVMYALTADQLAARDERTRQAAWDAAMTALRGDVLVMQ